MSHERRAKTILRASDDLRQSAEDRHQKERDALHIAQNRAFDQALEDKRLANKKVVDEARDRLSRAGVIELFEALIEQRPNWSYSINVSSRFGRPDVAASLRTYTHHSDGIGEAPGSDSDSGVRIILTGGFFKERVLVNDNEVGSNSLDELVETALAHTVSLHLGNAWWDGHWQS